jgi:hypothetical protein
MRYMLLVHHDELAFGRLSETEQQQLRAAADLRVVYFCTAALWLSE